MNNPTPIAIVAGANSRLGGALIQELKDRNYKVVAGSRTKIDFSSHDDVEWKEFDITSTDDCKSLIEDSAKKNNGIDLLVICSGYYPQGDTFENQTLDEIIKEIDITYKGPIILSKYFSDINRQYMKGDVVLISSFSTTSESIPEKIVYTANKVALRSFSEDLNSSIKPYGMRSFVFSPGQLSLDTDENKLKDQGALSFSALSSIIVDTVKQKGNAQISSLVIKPSFKT